MKKIKIVKKVIKQNPFTHEKIKVDKILDTIKARARLETTRQEFEKEIERHLISTNYKPSKKINYYKIADKILMVLAYLSLATILSLFAILWMSI